MRKIPICNACRKSQLECICDDDSLWDESCDNIFVIIDKNVQTIVKQKNTESRDIDILTGLISDIGEAQRNEKRKKEIKKYQKHRDKILEYQKKYYITHKKEHAVNARKYIERHKDRVKESKRIYYQKNRERLLAKSRENRMAKKAEKLALNSESSRILAV